MNHSSLFLCLPVNFHSTLRSFAPIIYHHLLSYSIPIHFCSSITIVNLPPSEKQRYAVLVHGFFWLQSYELNSFPEITTFFLITPFSKIFHTYVIQLKFFIKFCIYSRNSPTILMIFLNLHILSFTHCAVKFYEFWQMHGVMYPPLQFSIQLCNHPEVPPMFHLFNPLLLPLNIWQPLIFLPSL